LTRYENPLDELHHPLQRDIAGRKQQVEKLLASPRTREEGIFARNGGEREN
jgi:hypothetical protein